MIFQEGFDTSREQRVSRLLRQGFVSAGNGHPNHRFMLIPKPRRRAEFISVLPDKTLSWPADELGPAERRAMREIVEAGDLAEVDGQTYLVAPVSSETVDALAAFEAEGEDRENDLCDEPGQDDGPEGCIP